MNLYSKFATIVLMTALAISFGYLLSFIPNVELVLPIIFISGFITGLSGGILTGIITFLIYGYFNPYGPSPLFLLIAQSTGGAFAGILGGIYKILRKKNMFLTGILGFTSLLFYDIITTITGYFIFPSKNTFLKYVIFGIPFNLIHITSGTLIFIFVIYPLTKRLRGQS